MLPKPGSIRGMIVSAIPGPEARVNSLSSPAWGVASFRYDVQNKLVNKSFLSEVRTEIAKRRSHWGYDTAGAPATGLAAQMSAAWIAFTGKGKPDNPVVPRW